MESVFSAGMARAETKIGVVTCTAIVVANMIGTGVFTSLGFQVGPLPSGFAILVVWLLGATFALCGALAYAELAAALPRSGGEYNFLSRIYHPSIGFMAGMVSATVGFAAPVALAAMAFAEYAHALVPGVPVVGISIAIATLVAGMHAISIRSSQAFQNAFTALKITLILVLIGAGVAIGPSVDVSFLPVIGDSELIASAPFAVALMYVMYSYSGWNASTYIIGEVRDPARNVPWSLILGTLVVGVIYVSLNAVFLKTVPMDELAGKVDVANVAATAIFGPAGGRWMAGLISLGLISAISAMTWAGPRVAATVGEDFRSLRVLAWRTRGGIPLVACAMQWVIVMALLLTASFEDVLIYTQFALVACGLLTVLGVVVLRFREPGLARPFRCWGYPVTPGLFAAIAIFSLGYTAVERPSQAAWGIWTLVLGVAVYFAGRGFRRLRS